MKITGPWSDRDVDDYLRRAVIPLRLGVSDRNGCPTIVSLWFVYEHGEFWCATQRSARIVDSLTVAAACGFEVSANEPPYHGIRGQAEAAIEAEHGERTLRKLLRRYQGSEDSPLGRWLLSRAESEVAIRLQPRQIVSWDFTKRMAPRQA